MTEDTKQEEFRAQVLADMASTKTRLDDLGKRMADLEKTVVRGNGHPALTVQVNDLETKVDNLSREVSRLGGYMDKLDEMNTRLVELQTRLSYQEKNSMTWLKIGLVILSVIGTAIVEHYLR